MTDSDDETDDVATAEATVRAYYEALRSGDPLYPFFRSGETTTKFGITESLYGYDAIEDALREQTRSTKNWGIESRHLVVDEHDNYATMADEVRMEWTEDEEESGNGDRQSTTSNDTADEIEDHHSERTHRYNSRWSATLERVDDRWVFSTMHVSAPQQ